MGPPTRYLFRLADVDSNGEINGKEAAAFLYRCRLPIFVLRQMWDAVAEGANVVGKELFFIIMRLVALSQVGWSTFICVWFV